MKRNNHHVVVMVNAEDLEQALQISTPGTYLTTKRQDEDTLPLYLLLDTLGSDLAVHFVEGAGISSLTIHDCTSAHNHFTQVTSYHRSGGFDNKDYLVVHSYADAFNSAGEAPETRNWFFMSGYYTSGNSNPRHFIPTDIRIPDKSGQTDGLIKLNHQDISDVRTGLGFIADLIIAQQRGDRPESVASPAKPVSHFPPPTPSL